MGMTRRDFEMIAQTFNDLLQLRLKYRDADRATDPNASGYAVLCTAAWAMADNLAAYNPRFDRALFLKACGLNNQGAA